MTARSEMLREDAVDQRSRGRSFRMAVAERRYATMLVVRDARRLRYDRGGTLMAMADGWPGAAWLDADKLDDVINCLFRVSMILTAMASTATGAQGQDLERAIGDMDRLMRDIRLTAFDKFRVSKIGTSESEAWAGRIRDATAGIDRLFDNGGAGVFDLREASQAAHRAVIALSDAS